MRIEPSSPGHRSTPIYRGQIVRVRPEEEIASTLDADGKLEGMPFMPEMARHCGQLFRVYRRADKTCVEEHSLRRLASTVLLEGLRCDGAFHEDCQRNCLYFWKEAWLERIDAVTGEHEEPAHALSREPRSEWPGRLPTRKGEQFICQSTELLGATVGLSRWDIAHFLTEIKDGELTVWQFLQILAHTLVDRAGQLLGFRPLGAVSGTKEAFSRGDLGLQPGEWVEVKSLREIMRTLDSGGENHGLSFEPDMVNFAGGRFQVEFPIRRIILEATGRMVPLANTVALKGVTCGGLCRKNCPRNNTLYWREAWLRRISSGS